MSHATCPIMESLRSEWSNHQLHTCNLLFHFRAESKSFTQRQTSTDAASAAIVEPSWARTLTVTWVRGNVTSANRKYLSRNLLINTSGLSRVTVAARSVRWYGDRTVWTTVKWSPPSPRSRQVRYLHLAWFFLTLSRSRYGQDESNRATFLLVSAVSQSVLFAATSWTFQPLFD